MTTYVFDTSKGAGVPGLPHVITAEEADAQGLMELLQEAIENGSYAVMEEAPPPDEQGA